MIDAAYMPPHQAETAMQRIPSVQAQGCAHIYQPGHRRMLSPREMRPPNWSLAKDRGWVDFSVWTGMMTRVQLHGRRRGV